MKGQSFTKPNNYYKNSNGYQVIWNITEGTTTLNDKSTQVVYNYEYNTNYIPQALTYHEVIEAIVRETYSVSDELKLAFGRTDDAIGKTEHETFITNAKAWAKEILGI